MIHVVAEYLGLSEVELVKFAFQKQIIYKFIYRRKMAWIIIHSKVHLKHCVCNILFQFMSLTDVTFEQLVFIIFNQKSSFLIDYTSISFGGIVK